MSLDQATIAMMAAKGYRASKVIAKSLQGSVVKAQNFNFHGAFNKNVVIKVASKLLHSSGITVVNNRTVKVDENIDFESKCLKHLTLNGAAFGLTQSMVNFVDHFDDQSSIFLVMTDGGSCLFNTVLQSHQFITAGQLEITEWRRICQSMFKQMVSFIHTLHTKMSICHLGMLLA